VATGSILSTAGRALLASLAGMLLAAGVVALLDLGPLAGLSMLARAWVELAIAVVVGAPVIVLGMRLLRVREVESVAGRLERLVDRRKTRRGRSA
jgi:putative peptidoglycan lipid II flippase